MNRLSKALAEVPEPLGVANRAPCGPDPPVFVAGRGSAVLPRRSRNISLASPAAIASTMEDVAGRNFQGRNSSMRRVFGILLFLLASTAARAQAWKPLGPRGGDVRALAADPSRPERVFL